MNLEKTEIQIFLDLCLENLRNKIEDRKVQEIYSFSWNPIPLCPKYKTPRSLKEAKSQQFYNSYGSKCNFCDDLVNCIEAKDIMKTKRRIDLVKEAISETK